MFKQFFFCCQDEEKKDLTIMVDTNNNSNNCQISTNILNNDNTNGKIDDHIIETIKNIGNNDLNLIIDNKKDNKKLFFKKVFNNTFVNKNNLLLNSEHENNEVNINENEYDKKYSSNKLPKRVLDKNKSITYSKNNITYLKNNSIFNKRKEGSKLSISGFYNNGQVNNSIKNSIKSLNFTNQQNSSSKENPSFITFSNIVVQCKTNSNNKKSKSNLESDTEVLCSCELILTGDIFTNKELYLDRFGIKNKKNIVIKNNKKKDCELKFGIKKNNNKNENSNNNDNKKNYSSDISSKNITTKNEKTNKKNKHIPNKSKSRNIISDEISNKSPKDSNGLIKLQKDSRKSLSSLKEMKKEKTKINNSNEKNNLDIILNIPQNKLPKSLNENKNEDNIVLFILKYNSTLDMFEMYSCQELYPIELLINYNFQLRQNIEYNILLGNVKMKLKVIKNMQNQNVINISSINDDKKENKKNDHTYIFNPLEQTMPITIGRANCNINISNASVSKLHAQIDYVDDTDVFVLSDMKSTNGTYLSLKKPLDYLCINRDLNFRLFESKFIIKYINFES